MEESENSEPLTLGVFMSIMKKQTEEFQSIREEIKDSTKSIQDNANKQFKEIKESVTTLESIVKAQDTKIEMQEQQIQNQNMLLTSCTERMKQLEISLRKKNIILHNVSETEDSEKNLKEIVTSIITNDFDTNISGDEIEYLYRLGKQLENKETSKPRPLLIAFFSYATKTAIMQKKFKCKTYGISEDFPREVTDARRKLLPTLEKLRNEGKRATLRVDKLFVDGKLWEGEKPHQENIESTYKRKADLESPKGNENKKQSQTNSGQLELQEEITTPKPESRRQYLKGNQRTPTCTPILKFLAKKTVGDPTKTAVQANPSEGNLLNQTLR